MNPQKHYLVLASSYMYIYHIYHLTHLAIFRVFTRFTPHKTTLILNAKLVTYKLQQIAIAKRPDFFYNKRKELNMAHKKAKYAKKHKDRLFRFIFNQKSELLSLYNAVNDSDYTDENDLTIYTIEDFIYMGMKNDLSFLIDCRLNIYEHQSTYNPNMPLRGFLYMASALKKYIAAKGLDIYASSTVSIPVPQFYVFYNGTRNVPDVEILKLTDSMSEDKRDKSCTEFFATMININANHSPKLMKRCPKLYEYAIFISLIRENMTNSLPLEDAIEKAVTDCIHDNILADILRSHKAEVTNMILDEYDEKFHIASEKKLSFEEGRISGFKSGHASGIEEGRAIEKHLTDIANQRADNATTSKNILLLHLKQFSMEQISKRLNVSIDTVQETLKELDSDMDNLNI